MLRPLLVSLVIAASAAAQTLIPTVPPRSKDTGNDHYLRWLSGSDFTADRTFTLVPGDASRTLTLGADVSLNQSLTTTSTPTLGGATINMTDETRSIHLRPSDYETDYGDYGKIAGLQFSARTSTLNDAYNPPGGRALWNYQFGGYNVATDNNELPQFAGEPFFSTYLEDWWWRPSTTTTTATSVTNVANSVVTKTGFFKLGYVGRWLKFTTSGNNYRILSVASADACTIDGNAFAEPDYNIEYYDVWTEYHLCLGDANGVSKRVINIAYDTFGNFSGTNEMSLLSDTVHFTDWYASRPSMLSLRSGAYYDRMDATSNSIGEFTTRGMNFFSQYPGGSANRWFNHFASTSWQLGDTGVSMYLYGSPLTLGHSSGATSVNGSSVTIGNASFPTTITGSTITVADGKLERADFAAETGVYTIRPDEMRLSTGAPMSTSVVASTHRLVFGGYGSSGGILVYGNAANNNTKTDTSLFYFRMPPEYVSAGTVTVRINAYVEEAGNAAATKTITLDAREIGEQGGATSNLYAGGTQNLTGSPANYDFTLTSTNIATGDMLQIYFRTVVSESGGAGDNTVILSGFRVMFNVKG